MSLRRRIALDNNATQPLCEAAWEAMTPLLRENAGNPSSLHASGVRANEALEEARLRIATVLGCRASEIFFTSGATESINWALRGALEARGPKGHFVTSTTEHSVVQDIADRLEKSGREVTRLGVDSQGRLDDEALTSSLDDAALLSLIGVNNETGVRIDVASVGARARDKGVPFHVDGAQMVGKDALVLRDLPIDFLSFSAHKFGGPKGTGALYVRRGARLRPFVWGGHQEGAQRSGTENVPSIVGMAVALEESAKQWAAGRSKIAARRDRLQKTLVAGIPDLLVNGSETLRIENTLSVAVPGIEGAAVVLTLSAKGVDASSGSACSASDPGPSAVMEAYGLPPSHIHGALRFSLSPATTDDDIDRVGELMIEAYRHVARVQA